MENYYFFVICCTSFYIFQATNSMLKGKTEHHVQTVPEIVQLFTRIYELQTKFKIAAFAGCGKYELIPELKKKKGKGKLNFTIQEWDRKSPDEKMEYVKKLSKMRPAEFEDKKKKKTREFVSDDKSYTIHVKDNMGRKPHQFNRPTKERTTTIPKKPQMPKSKESVETQRKGRNDFSSDDDDDSGKDFGSRAKATKKSTEDVSKMSKNIQSERTNDSSSEEDGRQKVDDVFNTKEVSHEEQKRNVLPAHLRSATGKSSNVGLQSKPNSNKADVEKKEIYSAKESKASQPQNALKSDDEVQIIEEKKSTLRKSLEVSNIDNDNEITIIEKIGTLPKTLIADDIDKSVIKGKSHVFNDDVRKSIGLLPEKTDPPYVPENSAEARSDMIVNEEAEQWDLASDNLEFESVKQIENVNPDIQKRRPGRPKKGTTEWSNRKKIWNLQPYHSMLTREKDGTRKRKAVEQLEGNFRNSLSCNFLRSTLKLHVMQKSENCKYFSCLIQKTLGWVMKSRF